MKPGQSFYCACVLVALSMVVCRVQAATVVYEDFGFVSGETVFTTPFAVTMAGTYKAQLVDFEFPDPFDILALGITQQDGTPLGIGFGTGSFMFNVAAPGTLLAHLAAVPGTGGQGLYALQIMPIPIPSAVWLFVSGLLGMVTIARQRGGLTGER